MFRDTNMRRTDSQQWTAVSLLLELVRKYVTPAKEPTQSFAFIHILFWLIRSLVDPTLAVFIVCGPLQLVKHFRILLYFLSTCARHQWKSFLVTLVKLVKTPL